MKTKTTKIKKSLGERIFQVAAHIIIAILALICLYPFWYVVVGSLSNPNLLDQHSGILLKPLGFSFDAFKDVFRLDTLVTGYLNTFLLLGVGIPLNVTMTSLGAYFFSRKNVLFRDILFKYCMITIYISGGMIPFYLNFQQLGMTGNRWGVILGFCMSCYNMIILRTAFASVPDSLCDAAKIDGAREWQIFTKVCAPICRNMVCAVAILVFMDYWNMVEQPLILLKDEALHPLSVFLSKINEAEVGLAFAVAAIYMVPSLLLFLYGEEYLVEGIAYQGGVKG